MTTINLTYCGMNGSGPTVKEAKQDAARKIEAVLDGSYDPVVARLNGITGIAFRTPDGWKYTIVWADAKDGVNKNVCTITGGDGRHEVLKHLLRHMDDNSSDPTVVAAFLGDDKAGFSDWQGKQRFYAAYKAAREQGMNETDAHRYACEHQDTVLKGAAA